MLGQEIAGLFKSVALQGAIPGADGVDPSHRRSNPDYPSEISEPTTAAKLMSPKPEHDLEDVLDQIAGNCLAGC